MKKKLLFLIMMISLQLNAQTQNNKDFVFQKTDTISLTKEQLFNYTKEYIAEVSNNARFNTQNENKEQGIIQLNASTNVMVEESALIIKLKHIYTYSFDFKFQQKDNKYKIDIYNVRCESVESNTDDSAPLIQPFNGDEPINKTFIVGKGGIKKKSAINLMNELKSKLNGFLDDYDKFIRTKTIKSDW
ncbi:MAG: DUF4468 domain-containing protein [Lutibacter sp.]|nr:DUF4468 domain-containing protein [Lutibacter sp.]